MRQQNIPDGAGCPTCGGHLENGTTTFTAAFGRMVMVVYDTPAAICSQCGEELFASEVSRRFDEILADMKARGSMMEVVYFDSEKEESVA
jgi:YgiT-type zinc finger domain-containing protein